MNWLEAPGRDVVSSQVGLDPIVGVSSARQINKANQDVITLLVQFWVKPLANHVQSHRELDIRAMYEGLWCVSDHKLSLISQWIEAPGCDVTYFIASWPNRNYRWSIISTANQQSKSKCNSECCYGTIISFKFSIDVSKHEWYTDLRKFYHGSFF